MAGHVANELRHHKFSEDTLMLQGIFMFQDSVKQEDRNSLSIAVQEIWTLYKYIFFSIAVIRGDTMT